MGSYMYGKVPLYWMPLLNKPVMYCSAPLTLVENRHTLQLCTEHLGMRAQEHKLPWLLATTNKKRKITSNQQCTSSNFSTYSSPGSFTDPTPRKEQELQQDFPSPPHDSLRSEWGPGNENDFSIAWPVELLTELWRSHRFGSGLGWICFHFRPPPPLLLPPLPGNSLGMEREFGETGASYSRSHWIVCDFCPSLSQLTDRVSAQWACWHNWGGFSHTLKVSSTLNWSRSTGLLLWEWPVQVCTQYTIVIR